MTSQEKVEYRKLLDDIGKDYCPSGCYCIFKEFLMSTHPSRRTLIQLKCIDRLKLIKSKDKGFDVGWDQAFQDWINDGDSKKFAELYDEKKSDKEIFDTIIGKK
jgi:hypothetical protein